jgi:hypothetical protein
MAEQVRSPAVAEQVRSPAVAEQVRSPTVAEQVRTPAVVEEIRSPNLAERVGSPDDLPPRRDAGDVVLDYCTAVRGILNDDQGGPLHPCGVRMAEALGEVRQSLERSLAAKKGGTHISNCSDWRAASTEA